LQESNKLQLKLIIYSFSTMKQIYTATLADKNVDGNCIRKSHLLLFYPESIEKIV